MEKYTGSSGLRLGRKQSNGPEKIEKGGVSNMKRLLIAAISLLFVLVGISPAGAQRGAAATGPPATNPTCQVGPHMPDGHPDLSGVWWQGSDIGGRRAAPAGAQGARGGRGGGQQPTSFASLYQPWALEKAKTLGDKDDPTLRFVSLAFCTLYVSLFRR